MSKDSSVDIYIQIRMRRHTHTHTHTRVSVLAHAQREREITIKRTSIVLTKLSVQWLTSMCYHQSVAMINIARTRYVLVLNAADSRD